MARAVVISLLHTTRSWAVVRQPLRRLIIRRSSSIWSIHLARCAPLLLPVPPDGTLQEKFILVEEVVGEVSFHDMSSPSQSPDFHHMSDGRFS